MPSPSMLTFAMTAAAAPALVAGYAYAGYPALLGLLPRRRGVSPRSNTAALPTVTILVPAFNAAASLRATLDDALAFDYPADRRQILVVSDASDDGTDEIAAGYADRGVDLMRMPVRGGKTMAENAAVARCRGGARRHRSESPCP